MVQNCSFWLRANKIKAFYSLVDDASFQDGATSLLQAAGLEKMRPNILLMGYKRDWATCPRDNLNMYFNIIYFGYAHSSSASLASALDCSTIVGDKEEQKKLMHTISTILDYIPGNQSFSQLSQVLHQDVRRRSTNIPIRSPRNSAKTDQI